MGTLVSEMREGEQVTGTYLVREKRLATTRAGKPFLTLRLGDRSGEIEAKVWEGAEQVSRGLQSGDFVRCSGQVGLYNGRLQLTVESAARRDPREVNLADFLPASPRDPEEMLSEMDACIARIGEPHLRKLLKRIFRDKELRGKLRLAPAAKSMHHAYVGGLLEHTLSLSRLCEAVIPHFPEIDADLLRAGVLLHDLGKVDELSCDVGFGYSDRGRLLGHMALELERVFRALEAMPDFPEDKALLLKHLLLSHHGKEEFGSPVKPMTLEALILHMLDDLDAKAETFRECMADGQEGRWSAYHSLLGRYVFKGFGAGDDRRVARPEAKGKDGEEDPGDAEETYPTLF